MVREEVMKRILLSCVFTIVVVTPAFASFLSGNDLYIALGSNNVRENARALGYIEAIADVDSGGLLSETYQKACIRNGVEASQLYQIVYDDLNSIPEYRDYAASALVAIALAKAFPC